MTRTALLSALVLTLAACSVSTNTSSEGSSNAGTSRPPGSSGGSVSGEKGSSSGSGVAGPNQGTPRAIPGVLTAGVWDDNRNFDIFSSFEASQANLAGAPTFAESEFESAHALALQGPRAKQKLDIALMIDTTGSMGDEIAYLQKEFDTLATRISAKFPNAEQRWSLVLYRDTVDSYVTRTTAFTADIPAFRSALFTAAPAGGGDYPEASDRALKDAAQLGWRSEADVAKMMFWITDAPHHANVKQDVTDSVRALRDAGVHIYPVAASGADELTELTLRESAQITGGRYIFLTDDSGVGEAHKEPRIPCYFVTKLDGAVLRMVDVEMTGVYREPTADEVVRTAGDPKGGKCQLQSGGSAEVF